MFDTSFIDFLVALPIVLPLLFGLALIKIEGDNLLSEKILKILSVFLLILLAVYTVFLSSKFSDVSVMVFRGLFKVDNDATIFSLGLTGMMLLFGSIQLSKVPLRFKNAEMFLFLSLGTALIYAQNLILICAFAEIIFIKMGASKGRPMKFADLQGTVVRTIALILLLGSVAINYGAGNPISISFLYANSEALYSSDYLFALGALFVLSGSVEVFRLLFNEKLDDFDYRSIVLGLCIVVYLTKLSKAKLFANLYEIHDLLQWSLVGLLLYVGVEVCSHRKFKGLIKAAFISVLLMALIFLLPLVFDGSAQLLDVFGFLIPNLAFVVILLALEKGFSEEKGSDFLLAELPLIKQRSPNKFIALLFLLGASFSLPIGTGFLNSLSAFKLSFESGFYWTSAWVLFSLVLFWRALPVVWEAASRQEDSELSLLWKAATLEDIKIWQLVVVVPLVILFPLAVQTIINF